MEIPAGVINVTAHAGGSPAPLGTQRECLQMPWPWRNKSQHSAGCWSSVLALPSVGITQQQPEAMKSWDCPLACWSPGLCSWVLPCPRFYIWFHYYFPFPDGNILENSRRAVKFFEFCHYFHIWYKIFQQKTKERESIRQLCSPLHFPSPLLLSFVLFPWGNKALNMLGKHSTTKPHSTLPFII